MKSTATINRRKFLESSVTKDWLNPNRTILGKELLNWLVSASGSGKYACQVLGRQVLMGKMYVPAELLLAIVQIVGEVDATSTSPTIATTVGHSETIFECTFTNFAACTSPALFQQPRFTIPDWRHR